MVRVWLCLIAAALQSATAQHVLYACASSTKEYVVGSKLPASGLFRRSAAGEWKHVGYNHPWLLGVAALDPRTLLIAGGNGLIRATDHGAKWTIVTGGEVTELREVAVANGTVYFAHSAGIRASFDGLANWRELAGGLQRPYTESVRVDPSGALIAGGEQGVFRSEDNGKSWKLAGAAGYLIMRIEGSPHDRCVWIASTQGGGLFASHDCGRTFEATGGAIGFGKNTYDIAFDPSRRGRVSVAVWGSGIAVSEDDGKTWQLRNDGLPSTEVSSVVFDPDHAGRLYAAIHQRAVYVSDDAGLHWRADGLADTHVNRLRFVEEAQ